MLNLLLSAVLWEAQCFQALESMSLQHCQGMLFIASINNHKVTAGCYMLVFGTAPSCQSAVPSCLSATWSSALNTEGSYHRRTAMKRNLLTTDALPEFPKDLRISTAKRARGRADENSQLDRTREGCAASRHSPALARCRRIRASLPQVRPAARRQRTWPGPVRSPCGCAKPSQSWKALIKPDL